MAACTKSFYRAWNVIAVLAEGKAVHLPALSGGYTPVWWRNLGGLIGAAQGDYSKLAFASRVPLHAFRHDSNVVRESTRLNAHSVFCTAAATNTRACRNTKRGAVLRHTKTCRSSEASIKLHPVSSKTSGCLSPPAVQGKGPSVFGFVLLAKYLINQKTNLNKSSE